MSASDVLGASSKYATVNLAVPGATLCDCVADQLPLLAGIAGPYLAGIVVMIGTNDVPLLICGSESGSQFYNDFNTLISNLVATVPTSRVLAIKPPAQTDPGTTYMFGAVAAIYDAICSYTYGNPVLDARMYLGVPGTGANYVDGTHLSATGWSILHPAIVAATAGW